MSGICTTASINDFPKNDFLAKTHAIQVPGTKIANVHQKATLIDNKSAMISAGVKLNKSLSILMQHVSIWW